jgi:hypothetical protein
MICRFNSFRRYSHQLGFFLNGDRFQESFFRPLPSGHFTRPCPSLIFAVYLWGAHLNGSAHNLGVNQDAFLAKSLYHLPSDLAGSHPEKILHVLQAEILLSYYHLRNSKALGGNYHANAAVSVFLSSGLHRVYTPPWLDVDPNSTWCLSPAQRAESPVAALMTEGEYCDALSAVLVLNAYWTTIQESNSMGYDMQTIGVDSPGIADVQLVSS